MLFRSLARTYEALAEATSGKQRDGYIQKMYELYPQLLPFSKLTAQFQLQVSNGNDLLDEILGELKTTNIDFGGNEKTPLVTISAKQIGDAIDISYRVETRVRILQRGVLHVEAHEQKNAGKLLAYRLFGINKIKVEESPTKAEFNKNNKKDEKKV